MLLDAAFRCHLLTAVAKGHRTIQDSISGLGVAERRAELAERASAPITASQTAAHHAHAFVQEPQLRNMLLIKSFSSMLAGDVGEQSAAASRCEGRARRAL